VLQQRTAAPELERKKSSSVLNPCVVKAFEPGKDSQPALGVTLQEGIFTGFAYGSKYLSATIFQ